MSIESLARKGAALALLAGVLVLVYALAVAPIERRFAAAIERTGAERALLARLQLGLAAAAVPTGRRPDEAMPGPAIFLAGESDAVMAARLEALVSAASKGSPAVRMMSTRTLTAREHQGLRLIGLEARMTLPLADLQRLLLALDTATPIVLVETLQVSPVAGIGSVETAASEGPLEVRMEVFGAAESVQRAAPVREAQALTADQAEPKPLGGDNVRRR